MVRYGAGVAPISARSRETLLSMESLKFKAFRTSFASLSTIVLFVKNCPTVPSLFAKNISLLRYSRGFKSPEYLSISINVPKQYNVFRRLVFANIFHGQLRYVHFAPKYCKVLKGVHV